MSNWRGKKWKSKICERKKGFTEYVENLIEHAKRILHPVSGEGN